MTPTTVPRDAGMSTESGAQQRAHLSATLAASGLSLSAFARAIGVDRGTVSDWLAGKLPIPQSRQDWIASLVRVDVTPERVSVVTRR